VATCIGFFGSPGELERVQAMAVIPRSLDDIRRSAGRLDRSKVAATTEVDIPRHMIEDSEDPDVPSPRELPQYVERQWV